MVKNEKVDYICLLVYFYYYFYYWMSQKFFCVTFDDKILLCVSFFSFDLGESFMGQY